jgi:hypothetical protein
MAIIITIHVKLRKRWLDKEIDISKIAPNSHGKKLQRLAMHWHRINAVECLIEN